MTTGVLSVSVLLLVSGSGVGPVDVGGVDDGAGDRRGHVGDQGDLRGRSDRQWRGPACR